MKKTKRSVDYREAYRLYDLAELEADKARYAYWKKRAAADKAHARMRRQYVSEFVAK